MNDNFADDLVGPAFERVTELMQRPEGFDGALVLGDGENSATLQLDDYWAVGLSQLAEHHVAAVFEQKGITRWVFATPASYEVASDGRLLVAHVDVLEPKLVWALCYEQNSGYDLCALFYVRRPNGNFSFAEDITLLSGEHQMLDEAIGFTLMRDLLAA